MTLVPLADPDPVPGNSLAVIRVVAPIQLQVIVAAIGMVITDLTNVDPMNAGMVNQNLDLMSAGGMGMSTGMLGTDPLATIRSSRLVTTARAVLRLIGLIVATNQSAKPISQCLPHPFEACQTCPVPT